MNSLANRKSKIANGFTLIEMLTTVAVLVIVLGLMVSLARDVRNRSADRLTKDLLRRLDTLVGQYRSKNLTSLSEEEQKKYPIAQPLLPDEIPPQAADETRLRDVAAANSRDLVRTIKAHADLTGAGGAFADLSIANYNEVTVLDAW